MQLLVSFSDFVPSVISDHNSSTINVLCEEVNATRFVVKDDFVIKSKSYTSTDFNLTKLNTKVLDVKQVKILAK